MRCRLILSSPPDLLQEDAGDGSDLQGFLRRLLAAVARGDVAAFVLRTEGAAAPDAAVRAAVTALCGPLQEAGVAFLVEGRADLAVELGCDGVQVPANRTTVKAVRRALGADAIVGALCAATAEGEGLRHAAMEAGEAEADYVAFPASATEALAWWAELMEVPCVAWDADPADAAALVETGAEFIALAPALWQAADPAALVAGVQAAIDA
ncbi:thiamine-phosphate diphosphorylase [Tistlia consotensis]|uniref:Thiamine-phosphate diphosphorylase n=1 Tax=Tistlia consotensis USBA 355 TaxID=560819 RepID=A0A1Y6BXD8_9PROT|nr:thiamine phosphate synthase [Tistlia consotensis]SMF32873.1 thiamine-phosphate diphosphorylase [Tistlia consotensis USBA 355]SNR69075.1 thiamine-phosphate diphosphorylase [Tistlia consotensis]